MPLNDIIIYRKTFKEKINLKKYLSFLQTNLFMIPKKYIFFCNRSKIFRTYLELPQKLESK